MKPIKLDPKNESHWITHAEYEARRDFPKLTKHINPTLWAMMTEHGAPKPDTMSPLWNDWAGNNPQPEAKALATFDPSDSLMRSIKGLIRGARPCEPCE